MVAVPSKSMEKKIKMNHSYVANHCPTTIIESEKVNFKILSMGQNARFWVRFFPPQKYPTFGFICFDIKTVFF